MVQISLGLIWVKVKVTCEIYLPGQGRSATGTVLVKCIASFRVYNWCKLSARLPAGNFKLASLEHCEHTKQNPLYLRPLHSSKILSAIRLRNFLSL